MFGRFVIATVATAFVVALTIPTKRAVPPPARAVERESPVGLKEMVIERQANGHFYVDGTVNGQLVHFLVDTGSTAVALTAADAQRIGLPFSLSEFQKIGYGASGPVLGKDVVLDDVALGENEVPNVRGVILADNGGVDVSLLGQSYLERVGSVEIKGDEMVIQ